MRGLHRRQTVAGDSGGRGGESERGAERVEGSVDGAQGGFHGAGVLATWRGSQGRVGEDRTEQTGADLDEQRAEPYTVRGESIAPTATDPLGQAMTGSKM